eukprot:9336686-Lingulodinium_polyedra.AAC.1
MSARFCSSHRVFVNFNYNLRELRKRTAPGLKYREQFNHLAGKGAASQAKHIEALKRLHAKARSSRALRVERVLAPVTEFARVA